jgi:hypothetical protein
MSKFVIRWSSPGHDPSCGGRADRSPLSLSLPDFTSANIICRGHDRLVPRRTLTWTKREHSRGSTHLGRLGSRQVRVWLSNVMDDRRDTPGQISRYGGMELESPEASVRWRDGFRRHEAIRGLLERHAGLLRTADVRNVARDLGVSQATLYRLITTSSARRARRAGYLPQR